MFEGPIKAAGYSADLESAAMRRLRWADLVARLAATREMRPGVRSQIGAGFGEFSSLHCVQDEERAVNHEASSHGKVNGVSTESNANTLPKGF